VSYPLGHENIEEAREGRRHAPVKSRLPLDGASRWGHVVQIMVSDGAMARYFFGKY
jgi:hypothetical protein